jgi:uncharacterized protein (TIGR03437 family)
MQLLKRLIAFGFALCALGYYALSDRANARVIAKAIEPPPVGFTGAPGEGTCNSCHTAGSRQEINTPNYNPTGGVQILGLPSTYVLGQTYKVTVRVSELAPTAEQSQPAARWGFELTALDVNGASTTVGSLALIDSTVTRLRENQNVGGKSRTYVSHAPFDGTFPGLTGSATWSFNWTAPTTNVGDITFYAVGNAAEGGISPEYDYIFTNSVVVKAPTTNLILGLSSYLASSGATQLNLTVYGVFEAGSTVLFNGQAVTTQEVTGGLAATIPASNAGVYPVQVRRSGGALSNQRTLALASAINAQAAVTADAANYTTRIAPGQIAALFGANLIVGSEAASASALPLPASLQGTTVYVNGIVAPLFFASGGQINYQFPYGASTGQATVVVLRSDGMAAQGTVNVEPAVPALFAANSTGSGQAAALNLDFSLNGDPAAGSQFKRVKKGDYIILYGAGTGTQLVAAGTTTPANPGDGEASPSSPLAVTTALPTVAIGGKKAEVAFSGLAPGFVSLWQMNVKVPTDAPSGAGVGVLINFGGGVSKTLTIAIE